jgi:tRNA A37 threonylcarbamoyladenosine modification protein TsaB
MEAYAWAQDFDDEQVAVWRDAQRKQVFACLFDRSGGQVREILPPVSMPPEAVARDWITNGVAPGVLIGDGVDTYAPIIRNAWPDAHLVVPAPPLAPIAAGMAASRRESAIAPHAIVPIYVRATDAELARERRARETGKTEG